MKNLTIFLPGMIFTFFFLNACQDIGLDVKPVSLIESNLTSREDGALYYTSDMHLNEKPLEEWTKEWWKYVLSIGCNQNPLNFSHQFQEVPQRGPVAFLVGSKNGHATKSVTIYQRQSLLIPVFNTLSKYPRPSYDVFVSGENLFHLLHSEADWYIDQVTNIKVRLDEQPIRISNANRIQTSVFNIQAKGDLNACIDQDLTGQKQAAVSDGYWLVLRDLQQGTHHLRIHAEILQTGIVIEGNYTIIVL